MGALVGLAPQTKLQAPKIEIWNTINQWNFCQIWLSSPACTNLKPYIKKLDHHIWYLSHCLPPSDAHGCVVALSLFSSDIATWSFFFFRPRGLAVGCIIMTFGFAFLALPQFIGGRYEFDDISTNSSQGNRSLQITCEERLVNIVSYWFVYKMLFISRIMPIYPRLKIYAPCASCSNSIYCSYFPAEMNLSKASRGCCNLGYMYPL